MAVAVILVVLVLAFIVIIGVTRDATLTGFAVLVPEPTITDDAGSPPFSQSGSTSSNTAPSSIIAVDRQASFARVQALLDEGVAAPSLERQAITRRTAMPGELIVKFKGVSTSADDIVAIGSSFGILGTDEFVIDGLRAAAASGIYRLTFSPDSDMNSILSLYKVSPVVEWAELNYLLEASYTPNDPDYSSQWGLDMIDADDAWDVTTGDPATIIAVIDSGVYLQHNDLATNIWANPGEIANNDVDDDFNGRVDDIRGWNFVNMNNTPEDDNGHGTHVAGIVAAVQDNAIGISGVCPNCTIMPVRVLNSSGVGTAFDVAAGIYYAATNGADIALLSFDSTSDSALIRSAIEYAIERNVLVIAAAGNDDSTDRVYPAAYDGVIAVAATADSTGVRASYSNYNDWSSGIWIDVAAPGNDILSTQKGGGYTTMSGTSMAAAFAAGTAGLILSNTPTLSGKQAGDILRSTARIMGGNEYIGMGVINANNTMNTTWAINASFNHALHDGAFLSGNVSLNGTASGSGFVSFEIDRGSAGPPAAYASSTIFLAGNNTAVNGTFLIGFDTGQLPNGRYMLFLSATDGSQLTKDQLLVYINNTAALNDSSAINESVLLNESIVAPNGISITGSNLTLNCNGYWIIGNGNGTGITVNNKRNVTIRNCRVSSYDTGFDISSGSNITILTSGAADVHRTGINVTGTSNVSLEYFNASANHANYGISLASVIHGEVISASITGVPYSGIWLKGTTNVNVVSSTIENAENVGILIGSSAVNSTVRYCNISNSTYGVYASDVTNTLVSDTEVIADYVGIDLIRSVNATVERCTLNGSNFTSLDIYWSNTTVIRDVRVDGTKINSGGVLAGISVRASKDTHILNAVIVPNATSRAIYLNGVNTTLRNTVLSVENATMPAIWLESNHTLIENVTLIGWQAGIYAVSARNNTITNSTIGRSVDYGIDLVSSYDNLIYNNNLSNDYNAYDNGSNFWNTSYSCVGRPNIVGGPCFGGNHWRDYDTVGLDDGSGSGIHTTAGDMIGDTLLPWQSAGITSGGDYAPLYIQYNDTTAPTVTALRPVNMSNSTATVLNFTWNAIGNDLNMSCNLSVDGITIFSGIPLLNDSAVTYPYGPFADGTHTWQALCIDSSGNANWSALRLFVVDTTPPMIGNLTADPSSPVFYNETRSYRFTADAADAVNGISRIRLSFDNVTWTPVKQEPSTWNVSLPQLSAGTHNYSWIANDTLGNENTTLTYQYVVNKTVPVLNITITPVAPVTYNDTVTIGCAANPGDTSQPLTLYLNGSSLASGGSAINWSFKPGAGNYTINCTALESQNYTTASQLATLTVNRATPIINISFTPNASVYYNTWTNASCSRVFGDSATNVTLSRNGTTVLSGVWPQSEYAHLGAGVWRYSCLADESANFTNGTISGIELAVLRTSSLVNLTINNQQQNLTLDSGVRSDVRANLTWGQGNMSILIDALVVANGSSPLNYSTTFGTGMTRVTGYYPGNDNYTEYNVSYQVTMLASPVTPLVPEETRHRRSSDDVCNISYVCGDWGACDVNGTQTRTCTDVGNCMLRPRTERQSCEYNACANGIADAGEVDVDCGGPCSRCADGRRCTGAGDCASGHCDAMSLLCSQPPQLETPAPLASCNDGIQNQDENGIDCGGPCVACLPQPSCGDNSQNQDETGVDCGGSCAPCAKAKSAWIAVIPWLILVLAIVAFGTVAVLKKRPAADATESRVARVGTLLDTADGLLLEGRDGEANEWYDEARKIYERLTPDQKVVVEEKMTRLQQEIKSKGEENASASASPKTPDSAA
jgi:parallel beta-helix repeat protein